MSNDKKTLADAQPGGRVRLGDQAERARFEAWAHAQSYRGGNIMADRDAVHPDVYADPIAQLTWKSWKAALSAQHSQVAYHGDVDLKWLSGSIGEVAHRLSTYMPTGLAEWADRARDCRIAAQVLSELSAQPSPIGQGVELDLDRVLSLADVHAEESREDGVRLLDRGGLLAFAQDVVLALAARQPVAVAFPWENFPAYLIDKCEGDTISEEGLQQALAAMAKDERYCLAARQPVAEIDEAAVLRRAAAVLYMWEDDPNLTGYMGDFNDACGILELLAQHAAPPAQAVDLGQFIALAKFGEEFAFSAEKQPHSRVIYSQASRLLALIDKAPTNG